MSCGDDCMNQSRHCAQPAASSRQLHSCLDAPTPLFSHLRAPPRRGVAAASPRLSLAPHALLAEVAAVGARVAGDLPAGKARADKQADNQTGTHPLSNAVPLHVVCCREDSLIPRHDIDSTASPAGTPPPPPPCTHLGARSQQSRDASRSPGGRSSLPNPKPPRRGGRASSYSRRGRSSKAVGFTSAPAPGLQVGESR